jgi:hypothetical protein
MVASPVPRRNAKAAPDEREARPIRRRMRGRGIADPDPSSRAGILLDPPGYLNDPPTPLRREAHRPTRLRTQREGRAG